MNLERNLSMEQNSSRVLTTHTHTHTVQQPVMDVVVCNDDSSSASLLLHSQNFTSLVGFWCRTSEGSCWSL